jgi:membrane protein DedA with SNARE-associated domain
MSEGLNDLVQWMGALPVLWLYLTLLVVAYGENVVPPIPGDLLIVFGGYLVGLGQLDFTLVVLLATAGGALGFMTMYVLGYRMGQALLDPHRFRWLPRRYMEPARRWLGRWGFGVVAANRFLAGLRSVIALSVGMAHMPPGRTALWATVSALAWTTLLTWAGSKLGQNWEVVQEYLQNYGTIILVLAGLGVAFRLGWWWYRRPKRRPSPPEAG